MKRKAVTISNVAVHPPPDDALSLALEYPAPGEPERGYSVPLWGWALDERAPVQAIQITGHHADIGRLPVNRPRPDVAERHPGVPWAGDCGFEGEVGVLTLPQRFRLHAVAVLADGGRRPFATIEGERAALARRPGDWLQPVVVTTLGRSGSAWLTHVLARHPEIVSYRPFQYEPRASGYFASVLRALSQPASFLQSVDGDMYGSDWWTGNDRQFPHQVVDSDFERWLATDYVEELVEVFTERVERHYRRVAQDRDGRTRLFVEKYPPTDFVQDLLWELYPGMREIVLVRDFRDTACSILDYSAKLGLRWNRAGAASDDEFIRRTLSDQAGALVAAWRARSDRAHLLRYEELVTRPHETLSALLAYLGAESSADIVRSLVDEARASLDPEIAGVHQTSTTAEGSIGRWRRDLGPELKKACEESLGDALTSFGYARQDRP